MSPPTDAQIDQRVADAIGALGNRTRLEILLALAEAERERQHQWYPMSFTELYDAVDVDSTSQFSYHLSKLVGTFVAETAAGGEGGTGGRDGDRDEDGVGSENGNGTGDGGENGNRTGNGSEHGGATGDGTSSESGGGYRLTYSGSKIVRSVRSGLYESTPAFDDVDVAGTCVFCESNVLVATMDHERFVVRCESCDSILLSDFFPRSQARDRTVTEIVESVGARIWSTFFLTRRDVCPECYGRVDTVVDAHDLESRTFHTLTSTCRECWMAVHVPIEVSAALHPAAIGFFWDHGLSVLEVPLWEFFEYVTTGVVEASVRSTEPLEAAFEITIDDDTLSLAMDDTLTVTVGSDGVD